MLHNVPAFKYNQNYLWFAEIWLFENCAWLINWWMKQIVKVWLTHIFVQPNHSLPIMYLAKQSDFFIPKNFPSMRKAIFVQNRVADMRPLYVQTVLCVSLSLFAAISLIGNSIQDSLFLVMSAYLSSATHL